MNLVCVNCILNSAHTAWLLAVSRERSASIVLSGIEVSAKASRMFHDACCR